jgi:hypothetical protein
MVYLLPPRGVQDPLVSVASRYTGSVLCCVPSVNAGEQASVAGLQQSAAWSGTHLPHSRSTMCDHARLPTQQVDQGTGQQGVQLQAP